MFLKRQYRITLAEKTGIAFACYLATDRALFVSILQ
jgi:hypothetical protein